MTEEKAHDPATPPEAEGIPEIADDATPRPEEDVEPQQMAMPGDVPVALDEYGTTAAETRHGEPLSGRLAREEPDTPEVPDGGARIVEPDEGVREATEKDMVGRNVRGPAGDYSAEESAVNEEPPS